MKHLIYYDEAGPRSAVGSASDKSQRSRLRYPVLPHSFVFTPADSRKAVVCYWRKYVHSTVVIIIDMTIAAVKLHRNNIIMKICVVLKSGHVLFKRLHNLQSTKVLYVGLGHFS